MKCRVAALVFHPPHGRTPLESYVAGGRWAGISDLITGLREADVQEIAIVTPAASGPVPAGVQIIPSDMGDSFVFGEALKRSTAALAAHGVLYFGSGSGALLTVDLLERLVAFARGRTPAALFNNYYSCDFAAFSSAAWLESLPAVPTDNALGFAASETGVPCYAMPRDAATQFDIDTPTDLVVLSRSDRAGSALRAFIDTHPLAHPTLDAALARLADRSALTAFVGRMSPATWAAVEREVACRTSALSESRGSRAAPSGHVPWTRQILEREGMGPFFRALERAADAAWIDSRPLLAWTAEPPPADRFASDAFHTDAVEDPIWREFSERAREASIPMVLGGHGVVSGDLYLAAEACWKGRELPRRLHPEAFSWTKESS
ncbi:MAG: hypothetical protein AB1778_00825 [Candidatus Bipolaricaulota bacterium]